MNKRMQGIMKGRLQACKTQTHQLPLAHSSHPEVGMRGVHAPLLVAIIRQLAPLLLLARKEQPHRTLRERVERHTSVLSCKREKRNTSRILRGAE